MLQSFDAEGVAEVEVSNLVADGNDVNSNFKPPCGYGELMLKDAGFLAEILIVHSLAQVLRCIWSWVISAILKPRASGWNV